VLIFQGGAGFQLDTPTVAVRDSGWYGPPDDFSVNFADFDGDGKIDMAMLGQYPGVGAMIRFYWGDDRSPYSWAERPPDRDLKLMQNQIGLNLLLAMADADGDGAKDLYGQVYVGDSAGTYVYLSSHGKNARTRSFRLDDADLYLRGVTPDYYTSLGYLNDPSRRYEMLSVDDSKTFTRLGISGGPDGPDNSYEAYYPTGLQYSFYPYGGAIGDVSGDGYDDAIFGDPSYDFNSGVAFILAGGPYIPRDSTSLGVRDIVVAGQPAGLSLWPNPIHDELNIAWRGDLTQMPARFEVHDLLGRLIVRGQTSGSGGSALWHCRDVAAGTYILSAFDRYGDPIATATVIKL
jgi:hypothetical protein